MTVVCSSLSEDPVFPASDEVHHLIRITSSHLFLKNNVEGLIQHTIIEPRFEKTSFRGFRPGPTQKPSIQSQKQARIWQVWVLVEEELYYVCSKNKGADQLCSYCTADLCLCF